MHQEHHEEEQEFSFKSIFVPLTTFKAIHWIVIIGIVFYFNSLFNGFVWDDVSYIIQNPQVHYFRIFSFLGPDLFNDPNAGYYRPIPDLYFSFLYSIFQSNSFFYHFLQLLLHITNTILLFVLLKKFFTNSLSLFLSLIFIVHPIQVESVDYIAQTVSPLFFFFGISALLLSLRENPSVRRILLVFVLLLLSFLTKETGIIFLIIVLFSRIFYQRKQLNIFAVFASITIAFYALLRFGIGQVYFAHITSNTPIGYLTFSQRMLNIPMVLFYYLKTFFFPWQLAFDQKWVITKISFSNFYFPLVIDVIFFSLLVLFGAYIYRTKHKIFSLFLFFMLWFGLGMAFHSQIFPLDMTVADRWMYLPFAGFLGILGIGITELNSKEKRLKNLGYIGAFVILLLLGIRTINRNADWSDLVTLSSHDIPINDNADIEGWLARGYDDKGDYPNALYHSEKALSLLYDKANYEDTVQNIASIYGQMKDLTNAKKYYELALKPMGYDVVVGNEDHKHLLYSYRNYAKVLLYTGDAKKAEQVLTSALQDYPNESSLWIFLAFTYKDLHNNQLAIEAATKAYQLNPSDEWTVSVYQHITAGQPYPMNINGKVFYY